MPAAPSRDDHQPRHGATPRARLPLPLTLEAPRVVGIDDWAIRKGRTYGTILGGEEVARRARPWRIEKPVGTVLGEAPSPRRAAVGRLTPSVRVTWLFSALDVWSRDVVVR